MTFADMISKSVKRARESGRTKSLSLLPLIDSSPHDDFSAPLAFAWPSATALRP